MKKIISGSGCKSAMHYAPEKLATTVPVIVREYTDNEVRYYEISDGRIFNADIYDKTFKVINKKRMKRRGYKGENACKRIAVLQ